MIGQTKSPLLKDVSTEHLDAETKSILELPDEKRLEYIWDRKWITYPLAKQILSRLDFLVSYPRNDKTPCMLLIGDTNNGKTAIARIFCERYKAVPNLETQKIMLPVLMVQAPHTAEESRLYNSILKSVCAPFKTTDRVERKLLQVEQILKSLELKVLIIDEFQEILKAKPDKIKNFLSVLKFLNNELLVSVVCIGVKESITAITNDPHLANRFKTTYMPKWKLDADYRRLLASFELMLPLKRASGLAQNKQLATRIFGMCSGTIGEISEILKQAAEIAIVTGEERITLDIIDKLEYQSPLDRVKYYDKIISSAS